MTYLEAIQVTVTANEAKHEIEKHLLSFQDFQREVGYRQEYTGQEVLDWLGY